MLPAHYWTEMLQLGGAVQIRQIYLTLFNRGPRKSQAVLASPDTSQGLTGMGWSKRRTPLWFPRPRVEIISHRLTNYLEAENKPFNENKSLSVD